MSCRMGLVALTAGITGCAAMYGQTDDFAPKLERGCTTLPQCRQLENEARARVAECKPNTIGYVRCDAAEADLIRAVGLTMAVEDRLHAEKLAREAAQRRRDDEARAADEAKVLATKQAERKAAEEERALALARESAARERLLELERQEREQALAERERAEAARVQAEADHADYLRALTPAGRKQQLVACYAERMDCDPLAIRLVKVAATDAERTALAELNERLKNPPPEPSRVQQSSGSGKSSASSGGNRIQCCDGTLSPTCTCDRASLRGCCSHHSGVCGCGD